MSEPSLLKTMKVFSGEQGSGYGNQSVVTPVIT